MDSTITIKLPSVNEESGKREQLTYWILVLTEVAEVEAVYYALSSNFT